MSTGPVVEEDLRLAIQAELREMLSAKGVSQGDVAGRIRLSQGAVSKASARAELGQDFAKAFLRAYKLDAEALVLKHRTRTTAGDILAILEKYPALAETIREDSGRWTAKRLIEVAAKVKRNPPQSTPDGRLIAGSWREMLDDADVEPKIVGGVEAFRAQLPKKVSRSPLGG